MLNQARIGTMLRVILPTGKEAMLSALSVLPLPENRVVRAALAALVLTCIVMLALAALHVGDASAAPKDGWYRCWVDGKLMWCKDV
jgi:hypothetical protein